MEKRKEKGGFGHALGRFGGGLSVRGGCPIDNIKSSAKEVNWMVEPVGFLEMFIIVKGLKRGKAPVRMV